MGNKKYLIFDIETVPMREDSFDDAQKQYLLRNVNNVVDLGLPEDASFEDIMFQKGYSLSPLVSNVVCIGVMVVDFNFDTGEYDIIKQGALSMNVDLNDATISSQIIANGVKMQLSSECRLLEDFWKIMDREKHLTLVSFNGRNFDAPFIMLRSAYHKIRPKFNIMSGTKFVHSNHIDLLEELTFFNSYGGGAMRPFNFDFYARSFGITSPKAAGVTGYDVRDLFADGRIREISEYCMRDVKATLELFLFWNKYLNFK